MNQPLGFAHFLAHADGVAHTLLIVLALMSIGTWSLILAKGLALLRARRKGRRFLASFWSAPDIDSVGTALRTRGITDAFSHLVHHGFRAVEQHRAGTQARGLIDAGTPDQFLTRALSRAIAQDRARQEQGQTFLATVASCAPFVGLLGTVWGIHHALLAIGLSGSSSLDQVAGPVGEALIMTAIGLAVAIPAAVAHNAFARVGRTSLAELDAFAHDVFTFLATGLKVAPMSFASFSGTDHDADIAEINMVPMINIMLVLLVIFIVAAPLLTQAVKIDLPQASAPANAPPPASVTLSLDAASRLWWDGELLADTDLPARLAAAARQQPPPELHLRAERSTPYERIAELMAAAARAGLTRIGFVTLPAP